VKNDHAFDPVEHFGLFVREGFVDRQTLSEIVAGMCSGESNPATLYGRGGSGAIDELVRKSVRVTPRPETVLSVRQRLLECKPEIEEHFRVSLSECEEPQFLRYRVGDFFVAHQDGNTGLLQLDQETRRVSVVIFLSERADTMEEGVYCGGALIFHDWRTNQGSAELRLKREPGTLVAFHSETTHEVKPVTHGERLSIACWYR
jgi:SM-20-related protein